MLIPMNDFYYFTIILIGFISSSKWFEHSKYNGSLLANNIMLLTQVGNERRTMVQSYQQYITVHYLSQMHKISLGYYGDTQENMLYMIIFRITGESESYLERNWSFPSLFLSIETKRLLVVWLVEHLYSKFPYTHNQ